MKMTRFQFPVRNLPLPIQEIATEMEHLVDRMFPKSTCGEGCNSTDSVAYSPAMDVTETETQFSIELDLPGVKATDVKIELSEDKLTIQGTRSASPASEGTQRHREERSFGVFRRTLILPKLVDSDNVEAHYQDGVLNVIVPKVPKAQPKSIEIRTVSN
jgi:HSP20 family protein